VAHRQLTHMDSDDTAARQAYQDTGHAPGKPAEPGWYGRICHRHRVAYPTTGSMGAHFDRFHGNAVGYYTAEPDAA
jgi:hypothetical protein